MRKTRESKKVIRANAKKKDLGASAKKKDLKPIETEPISAKRATCNMCQKHTNNPSYCSLHEKWVGKKQLACKAFV